jgi:hypothetical protein
MRNNDTDGLEFTDEQLRAALKRMGRDARKAAFTAGRPVVVIKDRSIVAIYADGSEEILESLGQGTDANGEQE